jgi:hypothetical protein
VLGGSVNGSGGGLREAVNASCGGGIADGETRGLDENVSGAAQSALRVVPALGTVEGASSSAPKRKRGRPKGSKNKPKATNGCEPPRKPGRPAKPKAAPKRSLVQTLGHAQDDASAVTQSSLALAERVSSPGETSATSVPAMGTADTEASVPSSGAATVQQTDPPTPPSNGTPRNSPARPPLIPGLYVDTLVAFSPEKEGWTKRKKTKEKYAGVGSAYLIGRVCRIIKGAMFQVQWLDSQYQRKDEHFSVPALNHAEI